MLAGKGLGHYLEGLHGVSENNPKLHLSCLTSCMLNLKNKGYSINIMRNRLLQHINWKNKQEKQNRNTILGGSINCLDFKGLYLWEPCTEFLPASVTYQTDKHKTCEPNQRPWTYIISLFEQDEWEKGKAFRGEWLWWFNNAETGILLVGSMNFLISK